MPAIITQSLRANLTAQLFEAFSETSPTRFYMGLGRPGAWTDENNPPTPTDTIQTNYDIWRDLIAVKRVFASDRSYVTTRINWTNNTVYKAYSDTSTTQPTDNFYVLSSNNNVYKCIDNNRNVASTIQPTGTSTSIINTADGYRWKYMYTITAASALKFMTGNYIPVQTLTANDGSAQWPVQQAAVNGAIHVVNITANGTNWKTTSNTFASVANSTVMTLGGNADAIDDVYNYSTIFLKSGTGSGQLRRIINYVGASRAITVNTAFTTIPTTGTQYVIGPNVLIKGDGSTAATAYVSNCALGQVRQVTMISVGSNYSMANVTFTANALFGSGTTAVPVISPPGGHGSDAVAELYAHKLMLNAQITGSESNTFPTNNDFRIVSVFSDPKNRDGSAANATVIKATTSLTISGASGQFTADEIISGGTTGARARLVWFANTNAAQTAGVLNVVRTARVGTGINFLAGETLTGLTSGKTATLVSRTEPDLKHYTGQLLFVENRTPVNRSVTDVDDLKLVILL